MSAFAPIPQADATIIAQTLNLLFAPDDVIEIRSLSLRGRNRTDAGYYDAEHRSDLIREAVRLNGKASAVYVNLNPIDPQLLARYANRIQEGASSTATDANVTLRRWLLLDFDPVRPKDTSATNSQVEAAHVIARECYEYLRGAGWPEPVCAHSGNGYHLDYPIDLANDEASRDLIKAVLKTLAKRFDSDVVKVDQAVFNAGRIVKLYGTVANKGDSTESAPWRLSHIIKAPERNAVVTVEQLTALVPVQPQSSTKTNGASTFDLPGFLSRLNIEYRADTHDGRERYKLGHCPFNPEHGFGEAAVFRDSAGVLGFRCMHNTCTDKRWQDVRELIDGARESRTGRTSGAGATEPWPDPQPLAAKVEAEPYPLDALPDAIRHAVEEVQGFTKAPVALVASSALAALSLAIQAHVDVARADKLSGPTGVFLLAIADSGERKSTNDGIFTNPIRDYEAKQAELAQPKMKEHRAVMQSWEAKRNGIKDKIRLLAKQGKSTNAQAAELLNLGDVPAEPRVPRLIYGDVTPESLKWNLAKLWPSAGVVSAEGGLIFGAHGMNKESIMRNLSTLNEFWDGKPVSTDRRSSESFTVRGARLTMGIQVQEATLRSFFDRSNGLARGTGFLARFLVAWPESTQGHRPFTEAPENWPHLAAFNRRITEILDQPVPIDDKGALTPFMLPMTADAKAAWVEYHNAIETELVSGGELYDVRDVASKSADNAARLAGLFHVFISNNSSIIISSIQTAEIESASRIAAWHLNESRRFFGELSLPDELANAVRLDTWLITYCRREKTHLVPIAKVQQGGPGGLRSKTTIETTVRALEEAGRARWVKDGKRKMIAVNPLLWQKGTS